MAQTYDLCALNDVKTWLLATGATGTSATTLDAVLARLISATSKDFMGEIGRQDFYPAASYTETHEGDGDNLLTVRHWPINSVASLTVNGTTVSASSDKVLAGYYVDSDLEPERRWEVYLVGSVFTDGKPVIITYNAGYATVPPDVEQAIIEWVSYRYKGRQFETVTSAHMAQGETVQVQQAAVPPSVQRVIDRYRRTYPQLDQKADQQMPRGGRGQYLTPRGQ
jgi:hypothetical protein